MLRLEKIGKAYQDKWAIKDIDLNIYPGDIVAVLGPSGCGKTTLLNTILGLVKPDTGKIFSDDQEITNTSMQQRGFNIVFQDYCLFENLNARENIEYGLRNYPAISTRQEISELVEMLELKEHLNKRIQQLSGGQKQRVALARTLVLKPKLIMLDEPFSALDSLMTETVKNKIELIAKTFGLTIILVTHDSEQAMTIADKVLLLRQGRVVQYATPQEIIQAPANDFAKDFILKQLLRKRSSIMKIFGMSDAA